MQQRFDLTFQEMFKHARHGLLNLKDVNFWNAQVATYFPNSDFANTIIII